MDDGWMDRWMDDISGSSRMHLLVFTLLQCVKMTLVKWYNIYIERVNVLGKCFCSSLRLKASFPKKSDVGGKLEKNCLLSMHKHEINKVIDFLSY